MELDGINLRSALNESFTEQRRREWGPNSALSPQKVMIGSMPYHVCYPTFVKNENDENLFGECNHEKNTIYVADQYDKIRQKETLLHEIMHALDAWYNNNSIEEKHIEAMARGMFDFISNNKDVIEWIAER